MDAGLHCKVCGGPRVALYATKNGHDVFRCADCGFGQVYISADDLARFYDEAYWKGETTENFSQMENTPIFPSHKWLLDKHMRRLIASSAAKPVRLLELGPGLGGMVGGYLQATYPGRVEYEAIEISEFAAERLRARGFTIHTGGVTNPSLIDACRGRFDVIWGTEVIEHDPQPHTFAQACHAMLRPGGKCLFTTGNLDGWMARRKGVDWYYLEPPLHVSYYTPRAFRELFSTEGFTDITARRYGFNYIDWKLKSHLPGLLTLAHMAGTSTGMALVATKAVSR